MNIKVHQMNKNWLSFYCPGCQYDHSIPVVIPNGVQHGPDEKAWIWNGSLETPTINPSILIHADAIHFRCHTFIKDGKVEFLNDSSHALAGKTVEIPNWNQRGG